MMVTASLLIALAFDQTAPAATGRIAGRVTVEGANTPIAGARVIVIPTTRPAGPMGMPPQTLTDWDGRFAFDKMAPGSYRIDVQKTGFAPLIEPGRAPTTEVAAGQTVELNLQLQKGGVITGKLLDASGEPLPDARVMAMHRVIAPSGMPQRLLPAPSQGPQQTNDVGEFRVTGLAPGEYVVAAMPHSAFGLGAPAVTPSANSTAATTTYYPGTIDQAAAQPLTVAAGQTVDNINFSMQSVAAFRVSGRVVDENDTPVANAMVMLMGDPRSGAAFMGPAGSARTGDDGRFTIADVPFGTYRVTASVMVLMGGSTGAASGGIVGGISSVSVGAGSSGTFSSWTVSSSGGVSGGTIGGMDQAAEVVVNGANVTGVRVVAQRPTAR
jgi:protocatechuate 3,4-dioxygenase beta subunit